MLTKKNPERAVWIAAGLAMLLAGCSPSGPDLLLRGDKQLREGNVGDAVRTLEQAAELMPDNARAWNHLGLAYHAASNAPEARKAYARAVQFDPNFPDPHYNLGTMEFELGRYAEAEAPLRTFIAWQPKRADAWAQLGQTQYQLRQFDAAERSLVAALQIERADPEAWNTLGLIQVQRKRYREAVQQFAESLRLAPSNAAARLNLAVTTHQYLGDRRGALQHYREYLATQPQPADADAVRTVVRQLETQLGLLPKSVPTNAAPSVHAVAPTNVMNVPRVVTNPAPRVAFAITNTVVPKPVPTNPPASISVAPAPTNPVGVAVAPKAASPVVTPAPTVSPTSPPPRAVSQPAITLATNRVVQTSAAPVIIAGAPSLASGLKTNPTITIIPPKTSAPPVAVVASAPTSSPPPKVTASIPPTNPAPAVVPKPTVVRVEEPQGFLPARDVAKSSPVTPPPNTVPKPPEPSTPQPPPAATSVDPASASPAVATTTPTTAAPLTSGAETSPVDPADASKNSAKKSVLQRINPVGWFRRDDGAKPPEVKPAKEVTAGNSKLNPVNWFRGKEKDPNAPAAVAAPGTPLPGPVVGETPPAARPELPSTSAASASEPVAEVPAPAPKPAPKPAPVRYSKTVGSPPKTGNRTAASGHYTAALSANERREYPAAFVEYQTAVQLDPAYFEAQHNLAVAALNLGNLPVALSASENALALRPDSTSARWNYVIALQRGRYAADAAEELEKYVAVERSNARASLMLAGLYALDLGEPDNARPHYEHVLAVDPQHPQAESIRQWLSAHPKR